MAVFDILKGYKDYGTFIVDVFKAASDYGPSAPAPGDVVTFNDHGEIVKATSSTMPIATGVVFEADTPSVEAAGKYVVLLGQGIVKTDNVARGQGAPSVGDYVEVNNGVWTKASGAKVPSGVVLEASDSGVYVIYKFI
jgi:hypothetical protein